MLKLEKNRKILLQINSSYFSKMVLRWISIQRSAHVSCATNVIRWRMAFLISMWGENEMFCLLNKFVVFNNQKQPLKFVRQNSCPDLWSYTWHIIWQGVHLLVKLQTGRTNKYTIKTKSFRSISHGFNKCTKQKIHFRTTSFEERIPMIASTLEHDHDIIIRKSAESLELFWYEGVARRWIEIKIF